MEIQIINNELLEQLHGKARASERQRMNHDLRTSLADTSQRMLNALEPGTDVPIHQHTDTSETVVCLQGALFSIMYEDQGNGTFTETQRVKLCPREGTYGIQIPLGMWHTIEVLEPSVIFEAKDGAYKPR